MLTGLKDLDREILSKMPDRELLTVCKVDKRFYNEVCDDNFLRRRLSKYPGIEKYKQKDETWKQFFLSVIFYVAKMKEDFEFTYTDGDFKKQYSILKNYKNKLFLLYEAAKQGELSLVKHALKLGADIHFSYEASLRRAIEGGHLEIVEYLVENGANFHAQNEEYFLAAVIYGHLDIVRYLVENGADIHIDDEQPLKTASEIGSLEIVKYLVEKGAEINTEDEQPLVFEVIYNHPNIVKYLVENGALITRDAISYAKKSSNPEILKYLNLHLEKNKIA